MGVGRTIRRLYQIDAFSNVSPVARAKLYLYSEQPIRLDIDPIGCTQIEILTFHQHLLVLLFVFIAYQ